MYVGHDIHWDTGFTLTHCTGLEVSPSMGKFPFKALCEIAADGVVSKPVLVGMLFAPTQGLLFQTLLLRSFLFICTLHQCKHCTGLEGAPNVRKFPLTALCEIAADGVVSRPVLVGTLFAPTKGLHFQTLHPRSFLLYAPCNRAKIVLG